MLVNWTAPDHVYLVCGKTDLRKGIDGLAMIVAENYGLDIYDNSLFLFCGTRSDRFKGLYWDGEGFILLSIKGMKMATFVGRVMVKKLSY